MTTTKTLPMVAPNGMNFRKCMSNPNSRANKVIHYLRSVGPATRKEILRDVFGRIVVEKAVWGPMRGEEVTRGWGAYLFVLLQSHGYIRKTRRNGKTAYEVV